MTGNRYALDTNIVSAWLKNEAKVADKMDNAAMIFIPIIVVGELYYGARYSINVEHNLNSISFALSHYRMLLPDETTCKFYGSIKASLRKKGNLYRKMIFGLPL